MNSHRWVTIGLVSLLATIIVGNAMIASVPPVSRDALIHHLAVPKLYLHHGKMIELPDIPFSYYPMNLDLLYLIPLVFDNDIIPKYIHMLFGLFTAGLIFRYLRWRIGRNYGLVGALLWLSTPIVTRMSSEVYVDLGVAFFGFASLYQIIRWIDSGFRYKNLVFSAILCGLALGTKYNALVMLAVLTLMIPFIRSRLTSEFKTTQCEDASWSSATGDEKKKNETSSAAILMSTFYFVAVALLVFSPWMIRNMVLKQNPIYPMMTRVFNPDEEKGGEQWSQASSIVQKTGNTLSIRRLVFKESFGYIALIPLRLFIEGKDDDPRHFDGKLNPFLLIFMIAGIWSFNGITGQIRYERWIWFSFAMLYLAFVIFTAPIRVRYLAPILPAIIVLSVFGIHNTIVAIRRFRSSLPGYSFSMTTLNCLILAMFIYNGNYFLERYKKIQPITYLSGEVSRDTYITQRRPEYPLTRYANTRLAPDARILGLFIGQRRYYFDRDITFNENLFLSAVQDAEKPSDVMTYLHQKKITHLVVRHDLFLKWLSNNLDNVEKEILENFWNGHLKKLQESSGFALYALGS